MPPGPASRGTGKDGSGDVLVPRTQAIAATATAADELGGALILRGGHRAVFGVAEDGIDLGL